MAQIKKKQGANKMPNTESNQINIFKVMFYFIFIIMPQAPNQNVIHVRLVT